MFAVLEVGGTHVTSALVDLDGDGVVRRERVEIDNGAPAEQLVEVFAEAVERLGGGGGRVLAVAIPGPFDYERGIGNFDGVEKFGALKDYPVGAALRERLGLDVVFLNDVTAYGLGQYELQAQPGRLVAITLGTGLGSCFLADGVPVDSGATVPPKGWIYLLEHDGEPIEDTFSRRALMRQYAVGSGSQAEVREIAELALAGDAVAEGVFRRGFEALATTLSPWLARFGAEVLVVGGSIAESWGLVERWFIPVLRGEGCLVDIVPGSDGETAALLGAARHAAGVH